MTGMLTVCPNWISFFSHGFSLALSLDQTLPFEDELGMWPG